MIEKKMIVIHMKKHVNSKQYREETVEDEQETPGSLQDAFNIDSYFIRRFSSSKKACIFDLPFKQEERIPHHL